MYKSSIEYVDNWLFEADARVFPCASRAGPVRAVQRQRHTSSLAGFSMTKILSFVAMSLLPLTALHGTSAAQAQNVSRAELVLLHDTQLNVSSPAGTLSIVAGKGMARQYRWEGCVVDANMRARTSRWMGDFGMYDPVGGRRSQPAVWNPSCPEQIHMPVSEGQMHFADTPFAEEWLRRHAPSRAVWTNDGLVVSFVASRSQRQDPPVRGLSAQVTLICVNGRRPVRLLGATNEAIQVIPLGSAHATIRDCAQPEKQVIDDTRRTLLEYWAKWDGHRGTK